MVKTITLKSLGSKKSVTGWVEGTCQWLSATNEIARMKEGGEAGLSAEEVGQKV